MRRPLPCSSSARSSLSSSFTLRLTFRFTGVRRLLFCDVTFDDYDSVLEEWGQERSTTELNFNGSFVYFCAFLPVFLSLYFPVFLSVFVLVPHVCYCEFMCAHLVTLLFVMRCLREIRFGRGYHGLHRPRGCAAAER